MRSHHPILNAKYGVGWGVLFTSAKARYHENSFGELFKCSEITHPPPPRPITLHPYQPNLNPPPPPQSPYPPSPPHPTQPLTPSSLPAGESRVLYISQRTSLLLPRRNGSLNSATGFRYISLSCTSLHPWSLEQNASSGQSKEKYTCSKFLSGGDNTPNHQN